VSDLALDPDTWDLLVDPAGNTRLTVPGTENAGQRVGIGLGLWTGEYQFDTSQGIPYSAILGQKNNEAVLATAQQAEITGAPEISSLDAFALTVDPSTRAATTTFSATAVNGDPVEIDDFAIPGAT
jgi:hypothetical protein